MLTDKKLDFWIKQNLNVLMTGEHGVGKTSIIKAAFERNHLNWMYFSAATMDPWVDFVGIPKEQKDESGQPYLDLVRPKSFRDDKVEALFFDEYNRAPKKVKNAVMELIQFKSINGHKFKNLRIVWAAINPDDSADAEYDVEKLDPAQRDRFQIHITIPFTPDKGYFSSVFGNQLATSAIEWWKELPQDKKILVSPRRLDYALQVWKANGDIRDVLPSSVSATGLLAVLNGGIDFRTRLDKIVADSDIEAAKEIIKSNLNDITPIIVKVTKLVSFFIPLFPEEVAAKLASENNKISKFIVQDDVALYKAGKRYRCAVCKKAYKNYSRCSSHIRVFHPNKNEFSTCEAIN